MWVEAIRTTVPGVEGSLRFAVGWGLERPLAGVLFILPLAVLLLSYQRTKPRSLWLGTARFFGDFNRAPGSERRRSIPLARAVAVFGMLCAVLGLMGPRPKPGRPGPERFLCIVDRSPSMYLPAQAPGGTRGNTAIPETRISAAVRLLGEALHARSQATGRGVEVAWLDGSSPSAIASAPVAIGPDSTSLALPEPWAEAPRVARPEASFSAFDRDGVVWMTDRAPELRGGGAGYVSCGGDCIPGAIGTVKDEQGRPAALIWNGVQGAPPSVDPRGPRVRVFIDPQLPEPLAGFASLWASDRGVLTVPAGGEAELMIVQVPGVPIPGVGVPLGQGTSRIGRDGWDALIQTFSEPGARGASPWVALASGLPAISSGPGSIRCAIPQFLSEPTGGAAFAVSLAELFDGALLSPPGVVAQSERAGAGPGGVVLPRLGIPTDELDPEELEALSDEAAGRVAGALLALAALAGALAFGLRLTGR